MAVAISFSLAPMRRLKADPLNALRGHRWKVTGLIFAALIVGLSIPFARLIAINPTDSLPRGLYMKVDAPIAVGVIVEFKTPEIVRANVAGHYAYLLKPIVAGPGDRVDTTSGEVVVNGVAIANSKIMTIDSRGRSVPQWRENRLLGPDEFFVLSTRIPNSVDSRYFGPIGRESVVAVRRQIWTFD